MSCRASMRERFCLLESSAVSNNVQLPTPRTCAQFWMHMRKYDARFCRDVWHWQHNASFLFTPSALVLSLGLRCLTHQYTGGDGWEGPTCCNEGFQCTKTEGSSSSICLPAPL